MAVPHAHAARARRDAAGRHALPERRPHQHRRPVQAGRVHIEVRPRARSAPRRSHLQILLLLLLHRQHELREG